MESKVAQDACWGLQVQLCIVQGVMIPQSMMLACMGGMVGCIEAVRGFTKPLNETDVMLRCHHSCLCLSYLFITSDAIIHSSWHELEISLRALRVFLEERRILC